jgi:hypothetical protein
VRSHIAYIRSDADVDVSRDLPAKLSIPISPERGLREFPEGLTARWYQTDEGELDMASPTNWLIFYCIFMGVIGVITLLVIRAANKEDKQDAPDVRKPRSG